jgi:transmembrane 9 superfamily protein 2/4
MVSMIVYRSVSRDVRRFIFCTSICLSATVSQISRYNAIDISVRTSFQAEHCYRCANLAPQEDVQEDWGWKLVHGEVFRTPNNPLVLAALIGNGAQLCSMVGVTLGWFRKHAATHF